MAHDARSAEFRALVDECARHDGWPARLRPVRCAGRMSECGAAVAEAVRLFGALDVLLCCRSEGRDTRMHPYMDRSTSSPALVPGPSRLPQIPG